MHNFVNCSSFEGTAVNEETINFPRRTNQITVTNDDAANDLLFKFDAAENFMTAYAYESLTLNMNAQSIIITANGNSVPYRIWAFT